ncbi:DNA repair protein RecN [Patiriisocius sp. Uisw_017]|uniref:DNA repair protein RecN n=1 Tax=Patiriisocius sp. Uisw_017 TaxID=3230968 RepID=UPI0039EA56A9
MITSLSIKNYALIDDIQVNLSDGLTIITGETGAGKSILLGALSLLLGKRADLSSIKNATKKCIIEGEFAIKGYGLKDTFESNDLDYEYTTIVRREILPSGKSRAFVNDTPVSVSQVRALSEFLVDIHSQNDTVSFTTEAYQLEVVDALAGNEPILSKYRVSLKEYKSVSEKLDLISNKRDDAIKEFDYISFLQSELEAANLSQINQSTLETSLQTLSNAEEIEESFEHVSQLLINDEVGVLNILNEARSLVSKLTIYAPSYQEIFERINSAAIELEDIAEEINNVTEALESDPQRLQSINDTLETIYKLQSKHVVSSVEELIQIEEDLSQKINNTQHLDIEISKLETSKIELSGFLTKLALQLHTNRKKHFPELATKLQSVLKQLGLPNAAFDFKMSKTENFKISGTDAVAVYFKANKGTNFGLLKKVASGGEMSRILLAVKAVLARYKKLPTIIFDEIDTGVSGEIALQMAEILEQMSSKMQLISITHLPQIAAKGEHHFKVYKEEQENTTRTQIKPLTEEERIVEIAQMIGGKNITTTTLANAKELLN